MKKIVEMNFGSHLYGTDTPDSDRDYKGIFMPTDEEILLQRVPKEVQLSSGSKDGKNTAADVDKGMYSLHHFIHLATRGETVAIDMLHAGKEHLIVSSDLWFELVSLRNRFYTKNLRSLVGYARRQAAKYGIKGSRLADAKAVLGFLQKAAGIGEHAKLGEVWSELPILEHTQLHAKGDNLHTMEPDYYEVCGKKLQATTRIAYCIPILERFVDNYGHRARQAEQNQGIDWKAISHAYRAAYQVRHILEDGGFTYPLPETPEIVAVKSGQRDYTTEAAPGLDRLIDEVEELSAKSLYPDEVDMKFWDNWLVNTLVREYCVCETSDHVPHYD